MVWPVIVSAAKTLDLDKNSELPEVLPPDFATDENFLLKVHHILLENDIMEAELQCPETGRIFPILGGIPNMLLTVDEV